MYYVTRKSQTHFNDHHPPTYNHKRMGFILPSPPASPATQAQALILKKSSIETEIQSQISILQANNIDMTTPLVDTEGFPRADINIYAVRRARVRIIELRNDLRDVMNEAGRFLEEVYAKPEPDSSMDNQEQGMQQDSLVPFARVDGISPGSPAAEAGMQREDLILKFGNLVKSSFEPPSSLTPLATLVSQNEDKHIIIRIRRSGEQKYLTLTPRQGWGGRGMLGCHIVPYTAS
ncbi:hypothetical protein Agabi119p4_7815 [Agaricus bisporus var. burnettii]|uniref:Probable 26S proteasome regulatory subunit p27 n=1 Tax=Agaricus bisporus var. burnettii TaxID=192524 RepID=A0A8H7C899_AGABI|nr:hypothetical protein Agabi119p4_7815 [Agaricus bisporus var. burnettii]